MSKQNEPPALVDYPEAQRILGGLSRSALKDLALSGAVKSVRIGRRRLFPLSALEEFISQMMVQK